MWSKCRNALLDYLFMYFSLRSVMSVLSYICTEFLTCNDVMLGVILQNHTAGVLSSHKTRFNAQFFLKWHVHIQECSSCYQVVRLYLCYFGVCLWFTSVFSTVSFFSTCSWYASPVLVCNLDLFYFNRHVTFEQLYTSVSLSSNLPRRSLWSKVFFKGEQKEVNMIFFGDFLKLQVKTNNNHFGIIQKKIHDNQIFDCSS